MESFSMPTLVVQEGSAAKLKRQTIAGVLELRAAAHAVPYTVHVPMHSCTAEALERHVQGMLDDEFRLAELSFSPFAPHSCLNRCNEAAVGEWTPVSQDFCDVMQICNELHLWTRGAFDPVAAKVADGKWSSFELRCDLQDSSTPAAVRRNDATSKMDLSAISKGWCVDRIATRIARSVFPSTSMPGQVIGACYVDWGGDIASVGLHPSGRPWTCAVHPPPSVARLWNVLPTLELIDLEDAATCTSGSYSGIREDPGSPDGMRHLVPCGPAKNYTNPADAADTLVTVSVVHSSCAIADALSTVFGSLRSVSSLKRFLSSCDWDVLHRHLRPLLRTGERMDVFRIAVVTKAAVPQALVQDMLLPWRSTVRPTTTQENISAALAGRLRSHVALVLEVTDDDDGRPGSKKSISLSLTSFVALGGHAVDKDAAFFAMRGSRVARALCTLQPPQVFIVVGSTDPAVAFIQHSANAPIEDGDPLQVLEQWRVQGSECVTAYEVGTAPVDVGDHICFFLRHMVDTRSDTTLSQPHATIMVRRNKESLYINVPKTVAAVRAAPHTRHVALVTAWIPAAGGLLATVVADVDLTSREPLLLTLSCKQSKLDTTIFAVERLIRIHLFDDATSGEETLTSWFDDGNMTDSSMQFMYVPAPHGEGDAHTYTFAESLGGRRYPCIDGTVRMVIDRNAHHRRIVVLTPTQAPLRWSPAKPLAPIDKSPLLSWCTL